MDSSSKYRIAHFSDFHLRDTGLELDRATALLRDAVDEGVDHIVITGDIVDCAQLPVVRLLWTRLRRLGWTGGDRLTFCPGNHDIFPVSKHLPWVWPSRPTSRFRQLCSLTRYSRQGQTVAALGNPYPVCKVLSDSIVLAALDTTRNWQFIPTRWSEGELREEERDDVAWFLEQHCDKPHRLVAMHHTPLRISSECDSFDMNFCSPTSEEVQQWLRDCRATFVMCGHVHCETKNRSLFKGCRLLQSGTAGGWDDGGRDEAKRTYHIIEFDTKGGLRIVERSFCGLDLDEA
jgi:DNA repair exonuclease SbcCD nuclease subunit